MSKRFILISATLFLLLSIFSVSFAVDETNNIGSSAVNTIRNVVGGAENVIEDTSKSISNTIKEGTNSIENMGNNMTNNMMTNNTTNNMNNINESKYNIARTTTADGMNLSNGLTNTWFWVILGIIAVLAIALVIYYGNQRNYIDRYHDNDDGK